MVREYYGLNQTPKVTVRVNNTKSDFDEVYDRLEEMGYDIEEGYACPEAIIIRVEDQLKVTHYL